MKRSFQQSWFDRWPWLHYLEESDTVLCHTCNRATTEKKLLWSHNAESAFITKGFVNWKDATVKFSNHEASKCHKEAVMKLTVLPSTTPDIAEALSTQVHQERAERRKCFLKIVSNVRFLGRQGLPLRGHGADHDSNFMQLLKLRSEDDKSLATWLGRKSDKYTAPDMQNELLQVMAVSILRKLAALFHNTEFLTIMVDETTDIANKEQMVLCFRWVDESLEPHESFVGLYEIESTEASTILAAIHDVMLRLDLSVNKLRGQCYDGAASMAGKCKGVAKRILEEEPTALYTHCYGHSLNLACSDAIKGCTVVQNALEVCYEIIQLVKKSPRRDAILKQLKEKISQPEESPATIGIRALCPTRWTVRAQSMKSILANYDHLQQLWEVSLEIVKDVEMKSRIHGVSVRMQSFEFFFWVAAR